MTKQQAKQFAKIYVGQIWFDHIFKRDEIDASEHDKNLMEAEVGAFFQRILGNCTYMTPDEIYNVIITEE